jgi:nicotinate-nucleotide adenylyltransferase
MTGLFGGAFDPPHLGHLALADAACTHFGLERLVVIPTGNPPHKAVATPAEIRYRLAEAAFADMRIAELSRHELDRDGPSFTVDTARWAREQWGETIFLIGADEFRDFPSWHDPEGVLEQTKVGVATRPGFPRSELVEVLERLERLDRVLFFDIEPLPVSSTDVRKRVRDGQPVDHLCPRRVCDLIAELGLYRG